MSLIILERKRPWSMWGIYTAIVDHDYLELYCLSKKDKIIVTIIDDRESVNVSNITPICNIDDMGIALDIIYSNPLYEEIYLYPLDIQAYMDVIEIVSGGNYDLMSDGMYLLHQDSISHQLYTHIYTHTGYAPSLIVETTTIYREMFLLDEILTTMPNRECTMSLTHIPRHGMYFPTDIDILI